MKSIYTDAPDPFHHSVDAAKRRVSAVMTSPVRCVDESATLSDALTLMVRLGLRHLVVLGGDGGFRGILSDRVIAAAWADDPSCLSYMPVSTTIEARAVVRPGAHILDAARAMRRAATDAVAVLGDDETVIGIVTGSDMIAQLAR